MLCCKSIRAAHNFAGDFEMDARNGDVYAASELALQCGNHDVKQRLFGLGFYAFQFPRSAHGATERLYINVEALQDPDLSDQGLCGWRRTGHPGRIP